MVWLSVTITDHQVGVKRVAMVDDWQRGLAQMPPLICESGRVRVYVCVCVEGGC